MHIRENTFHDCGGFELDATQISNTSLYRDKIFLPYGGPLPAELTKSKAAISILPQIGLTINTLLYVNKDGITRKYPVQASTDELHDILFRFFYHKSGKDYHTCADTGLTDYWLGVYQSAFNQWDTIIRSPSRIYKVVEQLSADKKRRLLNRLMEDEAA